MSLPSSYHLVNRNGDLRCHAVGCNKHKRLFEVFGGLFCHKHFVQLGVIRQKILHDVSSFSKLDNEVRARTTEALFRKTMDPAHMAYLKKLEDERAAATQQANSL